MKTLSIIIVNTNERKVLVPCLRSIHELTKNLEYEVIVVDNASTDGTAEMLAQDFPAVRVIRNDKNLGFAGSNNRGIRIAEGKFVILLNPDTEIRANALQRMVSFMQGRPEAGIVGCKLFYADGRVQESVRSFPSVWNLFCEATFLYRLFPKSPLIAKYYMSDFDYASTREVDWVSGAAFMIRREVIDAIGVLDEQFFMYTEELEYCYRCWQVGFKVIFFHEAEITHYWGGPRTTNKRLLFWIHRSQVLFLRKHYSGIRYGAMVFCKYGGILLRVPVYGIAGILTFNERHFLKCTTYARTFWKLLLDAPDWS